MTPQEAKELLPIIQAYAEGKTIQTIVGYGLVRWGDVTDIDFEQSAGSYRIKPERKLRPWTMAEAAQLPVDTRFMLTNDALKPENRYSEFFSVITGIRNECLELRMNRGGGFGHIYGLDSVIRQKMMHSTDHGATWLPCGKWVEE